jgi:hypothetical protein
MSQHQTIAVASPLDDSDVSQRALAAGEPQPTGPLHAQSVWSLSDHGFEPVKTVVTPAAVSKLAAALGCQISTVPRDAQLVEGARVSSVGPGAARASCHPPPPARRRPRRPVHAV